MGKYVQNNLTKNETVIQEATRSNLALIGTWIKGGFSLLTFFIGVFISNMMGQPAVLYVSLIFLISPISALIKTITYKKTELAFTNKRLIGRVGWVG